jgi:hypothetical protein
MQEPQQVAPALPPAPPPPPGVVVGAQSGQTQIFMDPAPSAEAMLNAARNHRRELRGQLEHLEERRSDLVGQLSSSPAAAEAGLRNRVVEIDTRIEELDRAIAAADAQVAAAAAVPGAIYESPMRHNEIPEEAFVLGGLFMMIVLLPLSIALARRIWRRGTPTHATLSLQPAVEDRLNRLEAGVDSIALEIERIGEGQRFITKLMSGERVESLTSRSRS